MRNLLLLGLVLTASASAAASGGAARNHAIAAVPPAVLAAPAPSGPALPRAAALPGSEGASLPALASPAAAPAPAAANPAAARETTAADLSGRAQLRAAGAALHSEAPGQTFDGAPAAKPAADQSNDAPFYSRQTPAAGKSKTKKYQPTAEEGPLARQALLDIAKAGGELFQAPTWLEKSVYPDLKRSIFQIAFIDEALADLANGQIADIPQDIEGDVLAALLARRAKTLATYRSEKERIALEINRQGRLPEARQSALEIFEGLHERGLVSAALDSPPDSLPPQYRAMASAYQELRDTAIGKRSGTKKRVSELVQIFEREQAQALLLQKAAEFDKILAEKAAEKAAAKDAKAIYDFSISAAKDVANESNMEHAAARALAVKGGSVFPAPMLGKQIRPTCTVHMLRSLLAALGVRRSLEELITEARVILDDPFVGITTAFDLKQQMRLFAHYGRVIELKGNLFEQLVTHRRVIKVSIEIGDPVYKHSLLVEGFYELHGTAYVALRDSTSYFPTRMTIQDFARILTADNAVLFLELSGAAPAETASPADPAQAAIPPPQTEKREDYVPSPEDGSRARREYLRLAEQGAEIFQTPTWLEKKLHPELKKAAYNVALIDIALTDIIRGKPTHPFVAVGNDVVGDLLTQRALHFGRYVQARDAVRREVAGQPAAQKIARRIAESWSARGFWTPSLEKPVEDAWWLLRAPFLFVLDVAAGRKTAETQEVRQQARRFEGAIPSTRQRAPVELARIADAVLAHRVPAAAEEAARIYDRSLEEARDESIDDNIRHMAARREAARAGALFPAPNVDKQMRATCSINVLGGMLASLGIKRDLDELVQEARRFLNDPDVGISTAFSTPLQLRLFRRYGHVRTVREGTMFKTSMTARRNLKVGVDKGDASAPYSLIVEGLYELDGKVYVALRDYMSHFPTRMEIDDFAKVLAADSSFLFDEAYSAPKAKRSRK